MSSVFHLHIHLSKMTLLGASVIQRQPGAGAQGKSEICWLALHTKGFISMGGVRRNNATFLNVKCLPLSISIYGNEPSRSCTTTCFLILIPRQLLAPTSCVALSKVGFVGLHTLVQLTLRTKIPNAST